MLKDIKEKLERIQSELNNLTRFIKENEGHTTAMNGLELRVGDRVLALDGKPGTVMSIRGVFSNNCFPIEILYDTGITKHHPIYVDYRRIFQS